MYMDRTNVTENGYTYNGQNYTNQNRTDSQGNKYTVAIPSTIPAPYLDTPKHDIQIATPTYNTQGQQAQIQQAQGYINGSLQSAEQQATIEAERQKNAYNAANSDLARLQSELGGKAGDIANAYSQVDQSGNSVNSLAGKLRQLSAQSQALGYQNTIIPSQIQNNIAGTGATDRGIAPIQAGQLRNNMIQQATLAMQTAIVNADYQTAKGYADQIVEAKYDQKLADVEAKKTNINNIMFNLDEAQKKQAEATLARLNKEKQQYEEQKANEKAISDMMINASTQGAPADVLARAKKMQDEGAKSSDVAMALGQYGGDFYKIELMKQQIRTEKAQQSKIYNDINISRAKANNAVGTGSVTASLGGINPASFSEGNKTKFITVKGVIDAATDWANQIQSNSGVVEGLGAGAVLPGFALSQKGQDSRTAQNALALKVQQWASGASLTASQTKMVEKMMPNEYDSDATIKRKLNSLVNFMSGQVNTIAESEGQTGKLPTGADLFPDDVADFEGYTAKVDTMATSPTAYVSGFTLIK